MHFPLHRPVPPAADWRPHSLRVFAARRFARATAEFEVDLQAALDAERRVLQREASRLAARGAVTVARGALDSAVRVAGDATVLRHERMPLVVRPPATIRVLGPAAVADVVLDGLCRQAARGLPPDGLDVDERRIAGGRLVTVRRRSTPLWLLTSCPDPAVTPTGPVTELWFAPDGSARLRSDTRTGDRFLLVEPVFE